MWGKMGAIGAVLVAIIMVLAGFWEDLGARRFQLGIGRVCGWATDWIGAVGKLNGKDGWRVGGRVS